MIHGGTRLYGKVDRTRMGPYVATKFVHVMWFPFVPMGSWLVFEEDSGRWYGVPIGMYPRSWLMGWSRAVLAVVGLFAAMAAIIYLSNSSSSSSQSMLGAALTGGLMVLALAGFIGSYYVWCSADYHRAVKLAERAKFREEDLVRLELAYDRITPEEAAEALRELKRLALASEEDISPA